MLLILFVYQPGILFEKCITALAHRLLQRVNCLRTKQMRFPFFPPLIFAANIESMSAGWAIGESVSMAQNSFLGEDFEVYAFNPRGCPSKVFIDYGFV